MPCCCPFLHSWIIQSFPASETTPCGLSCGLMHTSQRTVFDFCLPRYRLLVLRACCTVCALLCSLPDASLLSILLQHATSFVCWPFPFCSCDCLVGQSAWTCPCFPQYTSSLLVIIGFSTTLFFSSSLLASSRMT